MDNIVSKSRKYTFFGLLCVDMISSVLGDAFIYRFEIIDDFLDGLDKRRLYRGYLFALLILLGRAHTFPKSICTANAYPQCRDMHRPPKAHISIKQPPHFMDHC